MSERTFVSRTVGAAFSNDNDDGKASKTEGDSVSSRALIHRVRWHTGLSQTAFADVYGIELEHLKAMECGAVIPDRALVAYLTVIDRAPEIVRAALRTC